VSSSYTTSGTSTFTQDVQNVVRKFKADLRGFAESTGGMSRTRADEICHDVEALCLAQYLQEVQVVLLSNGSKHRAATYHINAQNQRRETDRPGAAIWPRLPNPDLTVILIHTAAYGALTINQRQQLQAGLKLVWSPTSLSTTHTDLQSDGGRGYTSNGFGFERKDYRT